MRNKSPSDDADVGRTIHPIEKLWISVLVIILLIAALICVRSQEMKSKNTKDAITILLVILFFPALIAFSTYVSEVLKRK